MKSFGRNIKLQLQHRIHKGADTRTFELEINDVESSNGGGSGGGCTTSSYFVGIALVMLMMKRRQQ
ncbi:MAG: hypothetical protein IJU48_06450 [Synergistaceae bacterium]|nr:hypothetical protein [Synergistaceae bacterium]